MMEPASKNTDLGEKLQRAQATEARAVKKLADYMLQPGLRADTLEDLRRAVTSARAHSAEIQARLKRQANTPTRA